MDIVQKNSSRIFLVGCLKVLTGSYFSKAKQQSGKSEEAFLILCQVILILQKASLKWNRWMLHKCVFGIKSILISKYTLLCATEFSDHSKGVFLWCQLTYSSWGFGSAFVRLLLLLLGFCSPPPLWGHMMEIENMVPCRQRNTFNWFFLTEVFFIFLSTSSSHTICVSGDVWVIVYPGLFILYMFLCVYMHFAYKSLCSGAFSMHDIFYSKCLYVISAAQHMGKVQHQLVFLWLIRASCSTLGTVDYIPAHINDTSSLWWPPLGQVKYRAIPFFNCTSNYYCFSYDSDLVDIKSRL